MGDYTAGFTKNPGAVHATIGVKPRQPQFLDQFLYQTALCGRLVKVLLPMEFDPIDPDACERCAEAASRRAMPPEDPRNVAWRREQDEQDRRDGLYDEEGPT